MKTFLKLLPQRIFSMLSLFVSVVKKWEIILRRLFVMKENNTIHSMSDEELARSRALTAMVSDLISQGYLIVARERSDGENEIDIIPGPNFVKGEDANVKEENT